jgi:hypothetical protein
MSAHTLSMRDLAKAKLTRALDEAGVTKAAAADMLELKTDDFVFNDKGKLRNKKGLSARKFVESLRETRPEIFGTPPGKDPKVPHANNPFSAAGWNISRQGELVKAMGIEKAAGIAAAVGAKIGDTKPNKHFAKA